VWPKESNPHLPVRASRTCLRAPHRQAQTGPFSVWGKCGEKHFPRRDAENGA